MFQIIASLLLAATPATAAESDWTEGVCLEGDDAIVSMKMDASSKDPFSTTTVLTFTKGKKTTTRSVICEAPQGAASRSIRCQGEEGVPMRDAIVDTDPWGDTIVEVALVQNIEDALANGWFLSDVQNTDAPEPEYAVAEWSWCNGMWTCYATQADLDHCNASCGGEGDVSVDEVIPSNNLFAKPDCDVTCTCADGTVHNWINEPPITEGIE